MHGSEVLDFSINGKEKLFNTEEEDADWKYRAVEGEEEKEVEKEIEKDDIGADVLMPKLNAFSGRP